MTTFFMKFKALFFLFTIELSTMEEVSGFRKEKKYETTLVVPGNQLKKTNG